MTRARIVLTRKRIAAQIAALGCALLLSACASFTPANSPLARYAPDSGYRFERLERGDNSDELFVIVTFSGGGTRAAALAYGVLEALRDTTIQWRGRTVSLLDEVDVISSISGGSFPAAYYALRGRQIFDEFPDRFLYRPVQSDLVKLALWPTSWLKLAAPAYGRSDLAAEFYDREVFGGATYADIIARNRRPFVILNATDMTTGTQFPFIQDQFDLMCSDLAGVPLARAAASSSAFPGGLTALTFQNYAGTCQYRQPAWVQLAFEDHASRVNPRRTARAENRLSLAAGGPARRSYIHLTDGGVADNIGLRGPLDAIASTNHPWSVLQMMNKKMVDKLVVIVVNAATNPATDRDRSASVPGLIDTLTTAATVPLDNYSFDTVELLSKTMHEFNTDARLVEGCNRLSARRGEQCALNLPAPHKVDVYPIQVAFQYIASPAERTWFKNLPTSFELPRETIDKLRAVGRRLLNEDPQFQNLMKALNGNPARIVGSPSGGASSGSSSGRWPSLVGLFSPRMPFMFPTVLSEGTLIVDAAISTMDPTTVHAHEREAVAFQVIDSIDGDSLRGEYDGSVPGVVRPHLQWQAVTETGPAPATEGIP